MCKYKIGDVVTVKTWEEMEKEYGLVYFPDLNENCINLEPFWFLPEMKRFCGQKITIDFVFGDSYYIKEDNGMYGWTDSMFKQEV
jgi:hypothetical protein